MTELEKNTTEGVDWVIETREYPDVDSLVSSIHGGNIEIGTTELATLTSEKGGYNLFAFKGMRSSNNSELHVTSTHYDEPTMLRMVSNAHRHVAVHGASGTEPKIYVGGLDIALRNAIWEELVKKGLPAVIAPSNIIGEEPDNISNRTIHGQCVQLELTTAMRQSFFVNNDWSSANRKDRNNWTQTVHDFADAIVLAVEKSKEHFETDSETTYNLDFKGNLDFGQGARHDEKETAKQEVADDYRLDTVKGWMYPDKTTINGNQIETGSVTTQKLTVGVGNPNIMKSGYDSFEGMLLGNYAGTGTFMQSGNVTDIEVNESYALDGKRSLKIKSSVENDGYVYLSDSYTNYNIPLVDGKTYIFSFYAYSSNNTLSGVKGAVKLSNGSVFYTPVISVNKLTGWTRTQVKFTATGATSALVILYNNSTLSAWFDCLQIEEVTDNVTEAGAYRTSAQTIIDGGSIITGSLSFDKAKGGTVTLGGDNNANGKLAVYNSAGELIAELNGDEGGFSNLNVANLNAPNVVEYSGYGITNIYVSDRKLDYTGAVDPDDSNVGDGWTRPLATIEEAIRRIPKHTDGNYTIFLASGGKYYEDIRIQGFTGGGTITIEGQTRSTVIQGLIATNSNTVTVEYQNFTLNTTATYSAVYFTFSHGYFDNVVVNGVGNNGTQFGIDVNHGAVVQITGSEFYSCQYPIASRYNGSVYQTDCKGYGSVAGLLANGGTIYGGGTAPTGATFQSKTNGGQIFATLTANSGNYVVPAPPETTKVWTSTAGDSWRDNFGGQWYNQNEVVQGYWGGYGKYRGLWFFGSSPSDTVKGKTIKKMRLFVTREDKGGNSGAVTCYFRPHNYTAEPTGQPTLQSTYTTASFKWNEGKWITIPSSFYSTFQSGTAKGIGIWIDSSSSSYYAKFTASAKLEITYA